MSSNVRRRFRSGPKSEKNLLFCPHCDHESPTTGDWVLLVHETERDSWLAYQCPACGSIVTRRPLRR